MVTISFPGLGIGEFSIDPVAFEIPIFKGIEVRWYGLLITLGIILAFTYCAFRAKQEGINFDNLLDIAIFTIIFSVIGARAGYVLFSLGDKTYDSFLDVIAIWNGGLQIYGAIIAGAITIFVVCKVKKLNTLKMLDAVSPAVMIGQIIGRWGNFCNGEAHGSVVSESSPLYFLRMGLSTHNIEEYKGKMAEVHPTFFYESMWNLVGFIIITALYTKKKFDGQIVLMYLTWYGFGRMFIEMLRTDQLKIGVFPVSVVIGAVCFVVGTILLIVNFVKARREKITEGDYTPTYAKISHYGETTVTPDAPTEADAETIVTENGEPDNEEEEGTEVSGETEQASEDMDKDEVLKRFEELMNNGDDKKGE